MAVSDLQTKNEFTSLAKVCPFRSLLLAVDDGLSKEDLEQLIFLSKDKIGSERESEDIRSGRDLFEILIKRDVINKTSIDYLTDLLVLIQRFDLRKQLCKKWDAWKHSCPDEIQQPLLCENPGLSSQKQVNDHTGYREHHPGPTVPMLKIDGTDVEDSVNELHRPIGKSNHQNEESCILLEMCKDKPTPNLDILCLCPPNNGKRPRLVQQKCIDLSPTEIIYYNDRAGGLQCVLPKFGQGNGDRRNHNLLSAESRSSTVSTDSLEDQKIGFLSARNGRHLSPGSSFDSQRSFFSADSLDEPKTFSKLSVRTGIHLSPRSSFDSRSSSLSIDSLEESKSVKRSRSINTGRRQSPRSSFGSRSSSLSTDSLEEQNLPILEPDRALRTSVGF